MSLPELAVLNGLMRRQVLPTGARIVMNENLDDSAYVIVEADAMESALPFAKRTVRAYA